MRAVSRQILLLAALSALAGSPRAVAQGTASQDRGAAPASAAEHRSVTDAHDAAEPRGVAEAPAAPLPLLSDALRHPDSSFSFGGHAEASRVTHETARSDLSRLADRGLLIRRRVGREYIFEPASDLPTRLKESPA